MCLDRIRNIHNYYRISYRLWISYRKYIISLYIRPNINYKHGKDRLLSLLKDKIKSNTKSFSIWTTTFLIGLLIIYYIITLVNTNKISKQIKAIHDHPFTVAIAAGELNTCVSKLQVLPDFLFQNRTPETIDTIQNYYTTNNTIINQNIDFIIERYLSHPEDIQKLQEIYNSLYKKQTMLLTLCENPSVTDDEIRSFFSEHIQPLLRELEDLTISIIDGAKEKFAEFEKFAREKQMSTIFLSTILILVVIIALYIYLFLLKYKSKKESELRYTLKDALKSAQNASTAKSQFLSNMSHDIRTPMNAIIGMTAIASMHLEEPDKIKGCLNKISVSSKHLLGLINDVLDMSKIESGKIALNKEEFILPDFVHSFVTMIEPQIKAKQLQFDISIKNLEHEHVIGDTLRINQILLNIISNAIKFTPAGGNIQLKIYEMPLQCSGYGTYQFIISDTGIGMSNDFLEKIFEPFERVQTSTNSKIEGTGLGMAITKNIVDMMNGQIIVQSQLEKGTTFTITLHLQLQKTEDELFDFSILHELRSLIVDDDRDVCENTSRLLEEIGMKSEWVLTGEEAIDKVILAHQIKQDYHCAIIDWKMPNMDGLETTRRIRSIVGDETPIIILTAYDWTEIEEEAKKAGVNAFLAKPLFKSRLYKLMQDIINEEQSASEITQKEETNHLFQSRVLLVEDNALNMEIAQELLQYSGCLVEKAWDGSEAVEILKNSTDNYYNIIFMDIQMPHMNGYEATKRIRELEQTKEHTHTPIIAMSANAFTEDVNKAYACGMDAYITKPVGIEEIHNILKKYATNL